MSFKLELFGADSSNVKSVLGGICYYRYFNKNNDTLTNAGYFPADLGLNVGDRIRVVPATTTDADEIYIVTSTADRTVTVTQVDTDGAVDSVNGKTGVVVLDASDVGALPDNTHVPADVQYSTMPTAEATNEGQVVQFVGVTDATYTNGYFYKCISTPVYTGTVSFNAATISGATVACSGDDFATFVAEWGSGNITDIIKGTLTYDESGGLWVFDGKDDTDTTVCTFQLYTQDYGDAGFTFTGTPQDGDVIAFACTIEEGATYSWTQTNTQPAPVIPDPLPSQAGNSGKFLTTDGIDASWASVEALPSQTGNNGKFLTTNGTAASWATLSALQNTATGSFSLTIAGNPASGSSCLNIGAYSNATGYESTAVGVSCTAYTSGTALGSGAQATMAGSIAGTDWVIAIGKAAVANAKGSIQLGKGTNSDVDTFKVANRNGNFEIMNANGNLPADRLASTSGLADGNYRLRLTMASGVPTLSWVAE